MKKQKINVFGNEYYLLGVSDDGFKYYLEAPEWSCGWYWSIGYVETFTNNSNPEKSRDIYSHQHFDGLFLKSKISCYDAFKSFFKETPLSDREIWDLLELMQTAYNLRQYASMLHCNGSHITTNKVMKNEEFKADNEKENKRINEVLLPAINKAVAEILEG